MYWFEEYRICNFYHNSLTIFYSDSVFVNMSKHVFVSDIGIERCGVWGWGYVLVSEWGGVADSVMCFVDAVVQWQTEG